MKLRSNDISPLIRVPPGTRIRLENYPPAGPATPNMQDLGRSHLNQRAQPLLAKERLEVGPRGGPRPCAPRS